MRDNGLKKERDRDLYSVFKNGLQEGRFDTMRAAAEYVCKQPAKRYYIEPEKASVLVGKMLSGVSLINLNSCNRRMATRLYEEYKRYLAEHPGSKLSRERIMEEIIYTQAPEFYIEPQRTRKILYAIIKQEREKWGR